MMPEIEALAQRLEEAAARLDPAANEVRVEVLCAGASSLREWLGRMPAQRDAPEDLLGRFRDWAHDATNRARACSCESCEIARKTRWRCVFLLAEVLGLDPFGRTAEEIEEQDGERRGRYRPDYKPRCAGKRADGKACGGFARFGSHYCFSHQDQDPAYEPAAEPVEQDGAPAIAPEPVDPEVALDAEVDRWLAEARRAAGETP